MAEWSKALRSGRSPHLWAWVRIPLLTYHFYFVSSKVMENELCNFFAISFAKKSYNFNLDDSRKRRIDKFKCAICVQLLFNEPSFPSLLSVSQHSASLHCDAFGQILSDKGIP